MGSLPAASTTGRFDRRALFLLFGKGKQQADQTYYANEALCNVCHPARRSPHLIFGTQRATTRPIWVVNNGNTARPPVALFPHLLVPRRRLLVPSLPSPFLILEISHRKEVARFRFGDRVLLRHRPIAILNLSLAQKGRAHPDNLTSNLVTNVSERMPTATGQEVRTDHKEKEKRKAAKLSEKT